MNRYDELLQNDYSFQQYTPVDWAPNLEVMDEVLTGLQTEYDTGLGQLERIMPKHLQQFEGDVQGAREFRSKYDNLIAQTTDAFASGNINEGRRLMNEGLREIERDKLPGGDYYELERRLTEYQTEDLKLQKIFLDPANFKPDAYNYYKEQLDKGISPFKDEEGRYGTIQGPEMIRTYTDEEETNQMLKGISMLPASSVALDPEFSAAELDGLTIGDVMKQGLTEYLDPDKIAAYLKGAIGQDLIRSSQEKQRIRGEETTETLLEDRFNPYDPLGAKALQFIDSFNFSNERTQYRYYPFPYGGGANGRTPNGDEVVSMTDPTTRIIQSPTRLEVKTDNQLTLEGKILSEEQGFEIYQNTEDLYENKRKGVLKLAEDMFQNSGILNEAPMNVIRTVLPDPMSEANIDNADYFELPSTRFNENEGGNYNMLLESIQSSDPSMTPEAAKLQADKVIKALDRAYMDINNDIAYRREVQEQYEDLYVENLEPQQQELFNTRVTDLVNNLENTDFVKTNFTKILREGSRSDRALITNKAYQLYKQGKLSEDQYNEISTFIREGNFEDQVVYPEIPTEEIEKELQKEKYKTMTSYNARYQAIQELSKKYKPEVIKGQVGEAFSNSNVRDFLVQWTIDEKQKLEKEVKKYNDQSIHSEVSQKLLPELKRSANVLNYMAFDIDATSPTSYGKLNNLQQLQREANKMEASVKTSDGSLQEEGDLLDSANIYKVTGEAFESTSLSPDINLEYSKFTDKDMRDRAVVGIQNLGFIKGPDNKIYYYGRTQTMKDGKVVKGDDYVYYEFTTADNLTSRYYGALGAQGNVYEDMEFFNKQLDHDMIVNENSKEQKVADNNYIPGRNMELIRFKDSNGQPRYRLKVDGKLMMLNKSERTLDSNGLAIVLSTLKSAREPQDDETEPVSTREAKEQLKSPTTTQEQDESTVREIINTDTEASNNPLTFAKKYLGISETNKEGQKAIKGFFDEVVPGWVDDPEDVSSSEKAWCAAFANHVLKANNMSTVDISEDPYNALRAKNYQNIGRTVEGIESAKEGDVIVTKNKTTGRYHVSFYSGSKDGKYRILGGNQEGRVSVRNIKSNEEIVSVRRVNQVAKL